MVYYGRVNHPADELARLKGPVLGHFATEDGWITADMVNGFEQAMAMAGKSAADIDAILEAVTKTEPVVDVTADDGVKHTFWVVDDDQTIGKLTDGFEKRK